MSFLDDLNEADSRWPADQCWFCGGPAAPRHAYRAGVHRNPKTTFLALGLAYRDEWQSLELEIPRCGRCSLGHHIDVLLMLGAIPALAWGIALFLDTMLGTYSALPLVPSTVPRIAVWFLPFIAWLGLRFGWFGLRKWFPHNRRYVRRHPAVEHLLENEWEYGRAPMRQWDRRWF